MNRGIIFDLDLTLVDTSRLLSLRSQRKWSEVYSGIRHTNLYDGIRELVSNLRNEFSIGIVTSSPRTYATKVLAHHHLELPLLVAYHDTKNHKPHPDPILKGCQILGLKPQDVISVGDEPKDIQASKSAGVIAIAVAWGAGEYQMLESEKPHKIVRSVGELSQALLGSNHL